LKLLHAFNIYLSNEVPHVLRSRNKVAKSLVLSHWRYGTPHKPCVLLLLNYGSTVGYATTNEC